MKKEKQIESTVYNREYLLSDYLEGYQEFMAGKLSLVKTKQLEMLELEKDLKLLEIGFGRGELLYYCAKRGVNVTGIDYSRDAFEIGQQTLKDFPSAKLLEADCRNLPFEANSFDRIFSGDVIEHLCFSDAVIMLGEAYRVLKPGGFLLIHTTPNTVFSKFVYPVARFFLNFINRNMIRQIDSHFGIMKKVHIDEYNYFSLKKIARKSNFPKFKIWIDEDIFRSGEHRHTKYFKESFIGKLLMKVQKYGMVKFFLGNDLYLKVYK